MGRHWKVQQITWVENKVQVIYLHACAQVHIHLLNLVMTMEQRRVVLQGTENNYLNINSFKKYL